MRRSLIISLVVTFLMMTMFSRVWAEQKKVKSIEEQLLALSKKKEVVGLRTENSRTYKDKNGKRITFLATEPLNYQDKNGRFYPIDTGIVTVKTGKERFRHKATKNVLKAQFADESDGGLLLERGKNSIEFTIKHKNKRKAVVNKNKIRYNKVFSNCDLEYTVLSGRIKDELIFYSVPASPVISYQVNLKGLKHQIAKDGSIELTNSAGEPVFRLIKSFMYEKNNNKSFKFIDTRFHKEKNRIYCDLVLDMKWLKDKKRKYPVIIDPTVALSTESQQWKRTLLHCPPEPSGIIDCDISVTGPGYHGSVWDHDDARAIFKDLQGQTFVDYRGVDNYTAHPTPAPVGGHDFEVALYGGRTSAWFPWDQSHDGSAWAQVMYNEFFFKAGSEIGKQSFLTAVDDTVITKDILVKSKQTIKFNYCEGLKISKQVGDQFIPQSILGGTLDILPDFIYRMELSPKVSGSTWTHYQVAIDFPYLTTSYESKIVMATNPGYIDSTFKVPDNSQLLLQYQAFPKDDYYIRSMPLIRVYSDSMNLFERTFSLNYYNRIDGGDAVNLLKEVPYHLVISRGQAEGRGWGAITLNVHYQENNNKYPISNFRLVDATGKDVVGGFARGDYGLKYMYDDFEPNTLKEYTLSIQKTGENPTYYPFRNLNINNGQVTIPKSINSFGYKAGNIICRMTGAWDGFDQFDGDNRCSFTIDNAPPVISDFTGTLNSNNTLDLVCQAQDNINGSGLKSKVLTWQINDEQIKYVTLGINDNTYPLPILPSNAKVKVTLTVSDNVDNVSAKAVTYYTYPEKSNLIAPVAISGTQADQYWTTLKVKKVAASFYRIERYQNEISPANLDYDTGYLDSNTLNFLKAGPPSAGITNPYDGAIFTRPANITINANAYDVDGSISKVEFYVGSVLIGTDSISPYNITWNNAPLGSHSLTVKATDNDGLSAVSGPVNITVANVPPTVSITNGVTTFGTTVTVNATADDSDGTVNRVEFYLGSTLLGSDTTSPYSYSFPWAYASNTTYDLTAKAIDNDGGITTSSPVNIRYNYNCYTEYRYECRTECHQECHRQCDFYCWVWFFGSCVNPWGGGYDCYDVCTNVCNQVCGYYPYTVCNSSFSIENIYYTTPTPTPVITPVPATPPPTNGEDCYTILDQPAQKHQKYFYRIYTKNGDKELYQNSMGIPVNNNLPEIVNIQPSQGSTTYSNGVITIIPQVIDRDEDNLRYYYSITGPDSRNSNETANQEWSFGSITSPVQNGQYTWAVTVKDEVDGTVTVTGIITVDKNYPSASFEINNGNWYTNNQNVQLSVTDVTPNVQKIEIANNANGPWTSVNWNQPVSWNLGTDDGLKTIYLRASSLSGVPGQVVQRSITLDTNGPVISTLNMFSKGDTQKVFFRWTGGSDITSGLASKVNIQRLEYGQWKDFRVNYQGDSIEVDTPGCNTPVNLRVQLMDNAGNLSAWSNPITGYTLAASGSIDLSNTVSGFSSGGGHYINLKLNPAQGAVKYLLECTQNPGGGYSGLVDPVTLSYVNSGLVPHGVYKYKVLTYNSRDEITESNEFEVTVANRTPAKPAAVMPKGYITQTDSVSFSFDHEPADDDGDSLTIDYYYKNSADTNYTKLSGSILNGLSEGRTYFWYATINDGHGGVIQTDPVSYTPDLTPPVITVDNTSIQYALEHKVLVQVNETGSGLAVWKINGVTRTGLSGEVTLNSQGANPLEVTAVDQAGNVATYSHIYYVDRTPPTAGNIQFLLEQRDGKYVVSDNQIPGQWTATDPETGIAQFKYAWSIYSSGCDPGTMQPLTLMDQENTYQNIFSGDFEDGKTYYLHLLLENNLGLTGQVIVSPPLLYDHTAPLVKINGLNGGKLFGEQYYLTKLSLLGADTMINDPDSGITGTEYALVEGQILDNARWYASLDDLKTGAAVTHGKVYYLAVRVLNGVNLTTSSLSGPIFMETTGPELAVNTPAEQSNTEAYTAQVTTRDPETMVDKLEYSIGTASGLADLSAALPGASANGWLTVIYPAEKMELHQYANIPVGTTYYVTVKSTNVAGLVTIAFSQGTRVTGPSATAPEVADDGIYSSEKTALHFNWSFINSPKPIQNYEYRIRSAQGVIKSWTPHETAGEVSLLVTGLNLINNTQYFCDVKAKFTDGTYSGTGSSNGITVDGTQPLLTSFTAPAYSDGRGINLLWDAADPESGIKCYIGLGVSPGETGVTKGWLSLGNLKSYQVSRDLDGNPIPFVNGQKYYATLLVENGAGLAVQQTSAAVLMDLTAPPVPVVLDDGSYTNRADRLRATWKWTTVDPDSGIREYQYTIITKRALAGGEIWFSTGIETEMEMINLQLLQSKTYYIAVKAINNAGAESVGFSDGILIDTTAPHPPLALDFGDYSLSNNSLQVDLLASDAESGIDTYKLSLGTLESPDCVLRDQTILAGSGFEHLNLTGLALEEGKVYFFTVSAINNSSLASWSTMSDGIMVDSKPPRVNTVSVQGRYLSDPTRLIFDWQAELSPSGIIEAQYAITTDPNGSGLTWQALDLSGSKTVTGINLNSGSTYYVFVRIQNRAQAENTPAVWSAPGRSNPITIDLTPPEVVKVTTPADGMNSRHFLLQWEGRDPVSGIAEYRYAVGSSRGGTDVTDGWVSIPTSETSVSFYRDDLSFMHGNSYYISVMAKNGAGLWSPIYKTDAITLDITPPVITKLEYGSAYLRSRDTIRGIIWQAEDPDTGVDAYRIKPVTEKDGRTPDTPTVPTSQNGGNIDLTQLSLEEGRTYYIAIQVRNGVGEWSAVSYSQGIKVDTTPPVVTFADSAELVTNSGQIDVPWQSSEPGSVMIKLLHPNGHEDIDSGTVTGQALYNFDQTLEGRYTLSLTLTDLAGSTGETATKIIRLNAKPFANIGPDRKTTKGSTVDFTPEVSDSDGTVVEYQWDFGNGETSNDAGPVCVYRTLGQYTVTLKVKDNDGKWSDPAYQVITVTNTTSGELKMDEEWDGAMMITGDILVPRGVTLTVKAGARVDFSDNYQIRVLGKILVIGTGENPVVIGGGIAWNGIRLERGEPGSVIQSAVVQNASVGLVIFESEARVDGSIFKDNRLGIHLLNSNALIQNCVIQGNLVYGVKEDDGASPTVIGCSFGGNKVADYYEDRLGIISIEKLNGMGVNRDNTNR